MADVTQVSSLPLPPMQYVNLYYEENVRRGRAPKPPPPIAEYTMFGQPFHSQDPIIQPLENQGIKRLYPQNFDHRKELKKLNNSILVNFLDLLDILIKCPDSAKRAEKIEDMSLLFTHMHHLVNEFRPHQARETLRVLLELQKRQRLDITQRFQKQLVKVQETVQEALKALPCDEELDSKLLIPLEVTKAETPCDKTEGEIESCTRLDKLMCDIVDSL